jgi:hypothetical protein
MLRRTVGWVLWISDETGVKARVFQRRGETDREKNSIDFVEPVPRTATEAIKCFKEEPVFLRISFRVPRRRTNDSSLVRRENPMTKCILTITLSKRTTFFYREADQETKRVATKDGGKSIALAPNSVFMISQNDNARFSSKREEVFILFNCEDTHGRDCARRAFLSQCAIFAKGDLFECTQTFHPTLFLKETLHPNLTIRMGIGKRFQKGGRTFLMQVDRTDERGNGIKRRLLRGGRRTEESV